MYLYMEITTDEYQLPLIVTDSINTLALKCGHSATYLHVYFNDVRRGRIKRPKFIKVKVE